MPGLAGQLQHSQGQRSQHRQSQDHGSRNQPGPNSQLHRQPGHNRQARTGGARTKLRGADKARTRTPGIRRVKPRVRPATPRTGAARAARISAGGCRADKAGSGKPLRLRIAPLSRGWDKQSFLHVRPQRAKKNRRSRTPEVFVHAGLLIQRAPRHGRVALQLVIRRLRFCYVSESVFA
jgi:hypothetical protein